MYRQGDILLVKVGSLPFAGRGAMPRRDDVLLRGETTGHAHRIAGGDIVDVGGQVYVTVHAAGALLTHEEHDTITIPEGVYRVLRQREVVGGDVVDVRD